VGAPTFVAERALAFGQSETQFFLRCIELDSLPCSVVFATMNEYRSLCKIR